MYRSISCSVSFAALALCAVSTAGSAQVVRFEGPITYQVTPALGTPFTVTYLVKGSKIRFDVPQNLTAQPVPVSADQSSGGGATFSPGQPGGGDAIGAGTVLVAGAASPGGGASQGSTTPTEILDWGTGHALTFIPALKSYSSVSDSSDSVAAAHIGSVKITKTAAKETIADIPCDDYTVTDDTRPDTIALMCVASGRGTVMGLSGATSAVVSIPLTYQFVAEHFRTGFLPLKYVTLVQGKPAGQVVAVSVKRKTLADDLFDVPSSYRSTDAN